MKGGRSGDPGTRQGRALLAKEFRQAGLRPSMATVPSAFPVSVKVTLGDGEPRLLHLAGERTELKARRDSTPFSFSAQFYGRRAVVFAGYGITAPEYKYDDYAGLECAARS